MSIACQSREVVAGPTVGYQVGSQGDGSGYIRQQQQKQQQQDAMIRGLSCISIYVHSNSEGKLIQKGTDVSSLMAAGGHEMFRTKGHDLSQELEVGPESASVVLEDEKSDRGCNLGAEHEAGNGSCTVSGVENVNLRQLTGTPVERLATVREVKRLGENQGPKDSMPACSSNVSDDNSLSTFTDDDDDDMEVESKLKGPLDSLAALEDSLPIKRGLSNFFSGKSKSFTCLADVVSVKDLAKPESPYNRRRRNLLAYGNNWERNRFYPPRNSTAGISKKPMHSSKSTLALAVAMSKSEECLERDEHDLHLPPLPPQGKWQRSFASPRSFSLTDLQGV